MNYISWEGKMCTFSTFLSEFLPDGFSACLLEGHKYGPGELQKSRDDLAGHLTERM